MGQTAFRTMATASVNQSMESGWPISLTAALGQVNTVDPTLPHARNAAMAFRRPTFSKYRTASGCGFST